VGAALGLTVGAESLGGVVASELGWGLILYGEEEEDYLAASEVTGRGERDSWPRTRSSWPSGRGKK
jgi:hypothetical protein